MQNILVIGPVLGVILALYRHYIGITNKFIIFDPPTTYTRVFRGLLQTCLDIRTFSFFSRFFYGHIQLVSGSCKPHITMLVLMAFDKSIKTSTFMYIVLFQPMSNDQYV